MPISEPEIFSFRRHKRKQHLFPFNECSWNGSRSLMVATYSTPLTRTAKRLQVGLVSQVVIDTSRPTVFWFLGLKLPLWSNCGKSQSILLYGKSVKITVPPRWHTVISTFPLLFYWPDPSKVGWCHKIKFLQSAYKPPAVTLLLNCRPRHMSKTIHTIRTLEWTYWPSWP